MFWFFKSAFVQQIIEKFDKELFLPNTQIDYRFLQNSEAYKTGR